MPAVSPASYQLQQVPLNPSANSQYIGCTVAPETTNATAGSLTALSTTQWNLGLIRVCPQQGSIVNRFGAAVTITSNPVNVYVNVVTAPTSVTHSWFALFDMTGTCQAVTADGGSTPWGTGLQSFSFTAFPQGWQALSNAQANSNITGGFFYLAVVNNATGTAPKLSGLTAVNPEVNGPLSATSSSLPARWCLNSTSLGSAAPALGSTISLANNTTTSAVPFFAGIT